MVLISQNTSLAVDDVWGGAGLTDEAVQYNSDYANSVFEKYTSPTGTQTPEVTQKDYPTDLSSQDADSSNPIDKEKTNN